MGFTCFATNEYVKNQRRILVPYEVRKVKYYGYIRSMRGDSPFLDVITEGWEVAREVPVAMKNYDEFMKTHTPKTIGEKEVKYFKPKKRIPVAPVNTEEER